MKNEADDEPSLSLPSTGVSTPHVPVCTFNTSPCMPAPRAHVFRHVCAWCRYTRGRVEWTHGFFSVSHTTHHTPHRTHTTPQHKTQHTTTHHNNTTTTPHDNRDRERDRDRQRPREKRKEKREDSFSVWWSWPFFVHGVLCLVKPVNVRFFSLLNSVKYDSSLISFSAPWQVNGFFF